MSTAATASFLALSCVGSFAVVPALAADDPTAFRKVVVAAAEDDDPQDGRRDVVVNGLRQQRAADPKQVAPLVDTPRSIVTLDKDVIEQTGSNSLQDALRTVPGITFGAAEGGNPIGDRPFIRGFDSQGSIYVDGVRDFSSQSREVFAVESVQIVRGSDSTLGGRGSAGGTINIISKQPQLDDFGSVSGSVGNASYKRVAGDVNLRLPLANTAFRIEGVWHDQNVAGRDAIYQRRWGVAPSITVGIGTPTRLTAGYYHLTTHELPDSGLPYLYTIGNAPGTGVILSRPALGQVTLANGQTGRVSRSTFYGLADRDFRTTRVDQGTLRAEHDLGGVTLRNTARFTHVFQGYIYTQPDDSQGNVYGTTATNSGANLTSGGYVWRRANTRYSNTQSLGDQLDLYGTFRTGPLKHSFAAGAEVDFERARRGTYVTRGFLNANGTEILSTGSTINPRCNTTTMARYYCTSLFNPNPSDRYVNYASDTSTSSSPIARSATAEETQQDGWTQAVYAFDSITLLPSLILNLGARYDHFHSRVRPGQPYLATTSFDINRSDDLFNYQVGAVFKPTKNTSAYASYATAATPPNALLGEGQETNSVGTATSTATFNAALAALDLLKVTKTRSYEIGAKAQLFNEKLALTVAGFQTDTDNARVTLADGTIGFIGKTRVRGAELTYSGKITPWWSVFGGYTYLDPVIVDGGSTVLTAAAVTGQGAKTITVASVNTGRQTPQTPRHSLTAYTNITPIKRLTVGGGLIYTSRVDGGYADNRTATQTAAGVVAVNPATKLLIRQVPGYVRFDANASFAVTPHIALSLNAQNLTDKAYFTQAYSSHYATIAPGRTVFGTVKVGF